MITFWDEIPQAGSFERRGWRGMLSHRACLKLDNAYPLKPYGDTEITAIKLKNKTPGGIPAPK